MLINLRPALSQHLAQRLQAFGEGFRHNLALIGPPGSGKTFQLQQLLSREPEHMLLIYCPLYRESCRSFLHRLLSSVVQGGLRALRESIESGVGGEVGKRTQSSVEALQQLVHPHLPKTALAMQPLNGLLSRHLYGEAFTRTLDLIPILIEECGRPCVLMLDEFLFLEELGLAHTFHELGKRVMTWPSTLFILSSSSPYRARTILRERLQLLFGQFELLMLETLDSAIVVSWVARQLKGLRGISTISPFLIQWLGAYPWYLTMFLKRLQELAALNQQRELTETLFFQTAWDVLGNAEGTLHQWCISRTERLSGMRQGNRALEALLHVAHGARTATEVGRRMGRAGLAEALQLLVEQDLAHRNGTCWVVTDPILRCWLSTVVRAQRSDAVPDGGEVRQAFERYLQSLWIQWMQFHRLSFSEQVADLFARFADDTVSLDSKTGRLPHFDRITTRPSEAGRPGAYLIAESSGRRWYAAVHGEPVDENAITLFDKFCKAQHPKPSRKLVITKAGMDEHVKVLAKTANMWVWEANDLDLLARLYGHL